MRTTAAETGLLCADREKESIVCPWYIIRDISGLDGWMIATHAKRETKERKRQMTCVCVCVPTLCRREKYVAQVIHRWPTGGCAVAAAVAGKCHANAVHVCVKKWWWPVGLSSRWDRSSSFNLYRTAESFSWRSFRPWRRRRRRNEKVIASRDLHK